jgi:hypothetical protein
VSDFDNPWKEALDRFFPEFLAFFFPAVHADIDWARGYEALDKELQQILADAELGPRLADKLVKVWRKDGAEAWVLIHVEVQSQPDEDFAERMFIYNYRIFDRYRRPVVSLAVLGDERRNWRPSDYGYSLWGCRMRLEFPTVKLLDWANREAELEADPNPFAAVVLAHLKTMQTAQDPEQRRAWKVRLVKGLFERGLSAEEVRQLFRLIDWMMDLPEELSRQFLQEIHEYQEAKKMPYVTSIERIARADGRAEGLAEGLAEGQRKTLCENIELGLRHKFGAEGAQLMERVRAVEDTDLLRRLQEALWTVTSLDQFRDLLP